MSDREDLDKIGALSASCRKQAQLYGNLRQIAQSILGKLAISRGDVGGVMNLFADKQKILDTVMEEKASISMLVEWWQSEKRRLAEEDSASELNEAVEKLEKTISSFLESEDQLERYISHLTGRSQ